MNDAFEILFREVIIAKGIMIGLVVCIAMYIISVIIISHVDSYGFSRKWPRLLITIVCAMIIYVAIVLATIGNPWKYEEKYYLYIRVGDTIPASFFDEYEIIDRIDNTVYKVKEKR